MERSYKVTYAADSLDSNPTIKIFDCHGEMTDWISEEKARRIDQVVQRWEKTEIPVDEEELAELEEEESNLIRIEEV